MSAAAPNPNNMIILAVLGIGAFWFMSRRATAAPIVLGQQQQATQASKNNLIASGLNSLVKLVGMGVGSANGAPAGNSAANSFFGALNPWAAGFVSPTNYDVLGPLGGSDSLAYGLSGYFSNDALALNPVGIGGGYDFLYGLGF